MKLSKAIGMLFGSVLLLPALAQAAPVLNLTMHNGSQSNYEFHQVDIRNCLTSGPSNPCRNPWDGTEVSSTAFTGASSATSMATGEYGHFSASAFANVYNSAGAGAGATASGTATFTDSFTLSSSSLAVGTNVQVRFSTQLDWDTNALLAGQTNVPHPPQNFILGSRFSEGIGVCCVTAEEIANNAQTVNAPTGVRTYQVGQTVDVVGLLFWNLGANLVHTTYAEFGPQLLNLNMDAWFELEVLTAGVDLISESGASYSGPPPASVPEPATWSLLLGGGLLVRLFAARRA